MYLTIDHSNCSSSKSVATITNESRESRSVTKNWRRNKWKANIYFSYVFIVLLFFPAAHISPFRTFSVFAVCKIVHCASIVHVLDAWCCVYCAWFFVIRLLFFFFCIFASQIQFWLIVSTTDDRHKYIIITLKIMDVDGGIYWMLLHLAPHSHFGQNPNKIAQNHSVRKD